MPSLRWLFLALITVFAFWLRTHDLARRPMHADEANQAVKLGDLLETGHYAFDPRDHHGPTLYYAAVPIAWARGQRTLAALDETTVRLVPALFGTISVLLLAFIATSDRALMGAATAAGEPTCPALVAAALLAVSPPSVYYSRYFIQETLLVTFTLAFVLCARAWWRSGKLAWAIAAGVSAGLMQATKATAPLFLFAVLAAAAVGRASARLFLPAPRSSAEMGGLKPALRHTFVALLAAFLTAALFYSSFFTHVAGLRDAFTAYTNAATRFGAAAAPTGHEKPWWYFLKLFGWIRAGLVWQQLAFSALAVAGLAVAFTTRDRALRAAAVYTLIIVVAFSAFSYKTPWHAVHFVPGMALLAAGALAAVTRLRTGKFVAIAAAILVLGMQYQQTTLVAFLRPADPRNPYAYVHSSPDVLKYRALAEAALARSPGKPVRVISEEYWPLPWYLRGLPGVGYWTTPPDECDGALVIASPNNAEAVRAKLQGAYHESILGLRPGFVCIVFTPES
jgi:uncharacterized protein (TIGR03663 family)